VAPVRGLVIALALIGLSASAAVAAPPLQAPPTVRIYTDFATHGRLTHEYSRGLLQQILDDASLNQYGDPVVMMRLRRAVRQVLDSSAPNTDRLFGLPQLCVLVGMVVLSGGFAGMRARAGATPS
jgi:hypothetical protein